MNLDQYLDALRGNRAFMSCVTHWETLPAQDARYMDLPLGLSAPIVEALKKRGIYQLYTHQRQAVDAALAGDNVTIVTPTASGKTYCYNLPVLETILRSRSSRALYLFPTKALAADQNTELNELIRDAVSVNPPPMHRGRQLKILFMTQTDICPPKFIIFVNDPELMHFSYLRFIENRLREQFGFEGTPLRLIVRARKEEEDY